MRLISPLLLVLLVSVQANPDSLFGSYEHIIENRLKQNITIKKVNSYEEVEHRWRDGKWVFECRYIGKWFVHGDTLVLQPIRVVWPNKEIMVCRPEDDSKQPGCCFRIEYFYDDKSIWNFGPISKSKYVHNKILREGN